MSRYDIICIGAGPTGLATAIEAKRAGMQALVIDKGCLCNSIYHYPVNMVFFTTPELLEIGDLPLVCAAEKPTRVEALKYYRKTAEHYELELRLYERVISVHGQDESFTVVTKLENGIEARCEGRKIAVATGYYDLPNKLGVPGESLPHVSHYYTEPHEFWRQDVVVIGGKNSAAEAALDLYRYGARVTLIHRGKELGKTIKYWVRPDIENRIQAGQVQALLEARIDEITKDEVVVEQHGLTKRVPAKQVFALTGYHPDFSFLTDLGVELDPESKRPTVDPNSLESNVPGIHLAGVVIGGRHTGEIFIENGRFHGKQIIESLKA
jgi:thioredoxin reductase (NADPH)